MSWKRIKAARHKPFRGGGYLVPPELVEIFKKALAVVEIRKAVLELEKSKRLIHKAMVLCWRSRKKVEFVKRRGGHHGRKPQD